MRLRAMRCVLTAVVLAALAITTPVRAADNYTIDPAHSSVYFKISHIGLSEVYGRFNEFSGGFTTDPSDVGKCSFTMSIKPESIDTNNKQRDDHLRSPDFLNVKQFPTIAFKSTTVRAIKGGVAVTGDLTFHGVTKPVSFNLMGGKTAEFPKGVQRTGYSTEFTIKRADFGMDKFKDALGDEVLVAISFEGTKK